MFTVSELWLGFIGENVIYFFIVIYILVSLKNEDIFLMAKL